MSRLAHSSHPRRRRQPMTQPRLRLVVNPANDPYYRSKARFNPFTRLAPLVHTVKRVSKPQYAPLMRTVLDDRRSFNVGNIDLPGRSPVLQVRASARSRKTTKSLTNIVSHVINVPQLLPRAIQCAKKQIRREVLLAHGHGGGDHRPPSYRSHWRC